MATWHDGANVPHILRGKKLTILKTLHHRFTLRRHTPELVRFPDVLTRRFTSFRLINSQTGQHALALIIGLAQGTLLKSLLANIAQKTPHSKF
jgi:hypothetical protein